MARRVGLAARRHERRREKRESLCREVSCSLQSSPQTDFDDLLRVLDEELAAIPEELRAALVACFLQERTQDEAARELGWSLSTLRRRLERGKELLRSRLARRGVTLAAGLLGGVLAAPARAAVPPLAAAPSPMSTALAAEAFGRGVSLKLLAIVAGIVLAGSGVAYGLTRDATDDPSPPVPPTFTADSKDAPLPAVAPVPHAVEAKKKWVSVSGRVVFPKDHELPKLRLVTAQNIKDADVWKPFMPLRYEDTLIDPKNRGIANAVVFLRPDSDDRKAAFPADKIRPDLANAKPTDRTVFANGGQFAPRILVARAGDRVTFKNLLPVPTNVLYQTAQPDDGRLFNVLIGKGMSHTAKPLPAMRFPDSYSSSIYPWMRGYVWAFHHPYFSVTDANGRFEIPSAPAGKWRLVVWHEVSGWLGGAGGALGTKITIPESRTGKHELAPLTLESKNWPE